MKKKIVFDIESNGFLYDSNRIHCICCKDINSNLLSQFYSSISEGISSLKNAYMIIGHNICQFDIPLIEKLYGVNLFDYCIIRDTLCMSRLFYPERFSHSLESYGEEYGRLKPEHEDFSVFTKEMLFRCSEDVEINSILYGDLVDKNCRDWDWEEALELEQRFAYDQSQQELAGVDIDFDICNKIIKEIDTEVDYLDSLIKPILPKRIKKKGNPILKPFKQDGTYTHHVIKWIEGGEDEGTTNT